MTSPDEQPPHPRIITSLLSLFFRLLYHQFAWTYDLVSWTVSLGRWNSWIKAILPHLPGPAILELGHGPGHLQIALSKAGLHSIGLDQSSHMSRQAHHRLLHQRISPRLVNGLAQMLPFPSDHFDQLASTFPSEYIFDPRTLTEVYRVLRPGGAAVILPFAWITGNRPLERLAAWLFRITGESPVWQDRFLDPARQVGFHARAEQIVHPSSTLTLVTLTKPSET